MPLGSGALAGVNWEIDRDAVADDLGFEHVSHNSIDGASNRDFVLDYLAAASTCAMHLSRLGSEIVIWSSSEFGFCELDESFSSGSSDHAAEEEPRLGRAAAGEERRGSPPTTPPCSASMHAPAAHLRQGHAGGQGAALRRDRHGRALPRRDRGDARRDRVRPRAPRGGLRRRDAGGDRDRRPAGPQGACRSARRTGSSAAWSATRSSSGKSALRADPGGAARALRAPRRLLLRGARARAAGWSRSGSRAAPARRRFAASSSAPARRSTRCEARVAEEQAMSAGAAAGERLDATSSTAPSTTSPAS